MLILAARGRHVCSWFPVAVVCLPETHIVTKAGGGGIFLETTASGCGPGGAGSVLGLWPKGLWGLGLSFQNPIGVNGNSYSYLISKNVHQCSEVIKC